jgi:beta-lactamase class A
MIRQINIMMKQTILFFFAGLILLVSCKQKETIEDLRSRVEAELKKQPGVFAVAYKNLSTGEELLIGQDVLFHAASTMKTPVMIEVYKQASMGRFSLDDSILVYNEFRSIVDSTLFSVDSLDDSEHELYKQIGKKKRIYDLVYDMIISSSNLATNIVIDLVHPRRVTATARGLGARKIQILRGVEDTKAFEKGLINATTAVDLMVIFEKLAQGKVVDQQSCDAMIKILLDQRFNDIIPAKLPSDVKVAHKTGSITGVQHDSGIVFLPDGRKYVLVLLSKELKDADAATKSMANVSEMIYQHVTQ